MKEEFNNYLEEYKKKPLKEKQKIVYEQLKILAVTCNEFCKEIGSDNELIINKDLNELADGEYSEDDFVEAVLVLTNSIQNSISDFHLQMSEVLKQYLD